MGNVIISLKKIVKLYDIYTLWTLNGSIRLPITPDLDSAFFVK